VKALTKKERQDEIQLTAKIGGKNCLDPNLFRFVKFSFPVNRLVMPCYFETGRSRPLIARLY
jgi:hypothetical protein